MGALPQRDRTGGRCQRRRPTVRAGPRPERPRRRRPGRARPRSGSPAVPKDTGNEEGNEQQGRRCVGGCIRARQGRTPSTSWRPPGGTTYGMGRREDDVDGDGWPVDIRRRACFERKSDRRGRCTHVQALPVDGLDGRLDRGRGTGWDRGRDGRGWLDRAEEGWDTEVNEDIEGQLICDRHSRQAIPQTQEDQSSFAVHRALHSL